MSENKTRKEVTSVREREKERERERERERIPDQTGDSNIIFE